MCSQNLQRTDVKEIGRQTLASNLEPFFKIGTTSALLHVEGVFPDLKKLEKAE